MRVKRNGCCLLCERVALAREKHTDLHIVGKHFILYHCFVWFFDKNKKTVLHGLIFEVRSEKVILK